MKLKSNRVTFRFTDVSVNSVYDLRYDDNGKSLMRDRKVNTWRVFISINFGEWHKIGLTSESPNRTNARSWCEDVYNFNKDYFNQVNINKTP